LRHHNTSPSFLRPAAKSFCVNTDLAGTLIPTHLAWNNYAIEPDGDSIYYDFGEPLSARNTPIPFAAGLDYQNPFEVVPGTQIKIDHKNGFFYFSLSKGQVAVAKIVAT